MKKTLLISFLVGIVVFYLLQKFSIIEGMTGTTGTTTSSPSPSTSASATSATSTSATTNTETSITLPSASTTPPPVPKPPLSSYKMVASTGAAIPETSAAIIAATTAASKTAASKTAASTIDTNKIEANPIPPPTNTPTNTPTNKSAPIGSSPKHGAPISSNRNDFLEENGFLYFDSRGTGTGSGFYSQDVPFFPTEDYWIPPGVMDLYDTPMPLIISDDTNYASSTVATAPTTLPQTVTTAPPTAPPIQTPHVTLSLGPILIALALITLMIFLFSR